MSTRSVRGVLAVFVALIVLMAMATPAAATTDLTIDATSDIDDGVTITDFNASSDMSSDLVANVDGDAHDIATAEVTIELDDADRDITVYEADLDSDEHSVADEGTIDELHTWEISHDEFDDVPMAIDETVDLNATVEIEAEDGTEDNITVTFSLANTDERSVMVIDSDSIDEDDIGPEASSFEEDVGGFVGFFADEETFYEVDSEDVAINGSETDVFIYADDSDVADALSEAIEEEDGFFGADAVDDGEPIPEMAMLVDGDLILTYANEAGDAVDTDEDTYAVFHEDDDLLELHLGSEDYDVDDDEEVDVFAATHSPSFDGLVERSEIAEVFGSELGFSELRTAFDIRTAFDAWMLDDDEFRYVSGFIAPLVVTGTAVSAKRRAAAEA